MRLETKRLLMKEYTLDDIESYYALKSCKPVWEFSTYTPLTDRQAAQTGLNELIRAAKENPHVFCALFLKETNTYVGEAGILSFHQSANRCAIGYNLLPDFWNNGYATEITRELVRYAFIELHVERVEALVQKENIASCNVLEKSGLLLEGVLRHFGKIRGESIDVCYYGMISQDFYSERISE